MNGIHATARIHDATKGEAGARASRIAEWLHLAAAPTFAVMALLTGIAGSGAADMLCSPTHGMSPLGGMTAMYLLMAAFHASPWLRLASHGWRSAMRSGSHR
ncbi:MAG: hypothetical protein ACREPY_11945 [Rhodanobacteraceae bacterium]